MQGHDRTRDMPCPADCPHRAAARCPIEAHNRPDALLGASSVASAAPATASASGAPPPAPFAFGGLAQPQALCVRCKAPAFDVCKTCAGRFCYAHRYNHGCPCEHPGCSAAIVELCRYCHKRFCRVHATPGIHACARCNHNVRDAQFCTTAGVATCPHCGKQYCELHLASHAVVTGAWRTIPTRHNIAADLRRRGKTFENAAEAGGCVSFGCRNTRVVQCEDCGLTYCKTHYAHEGSKAELVGSRLPCESVRNPAERAILIGRCPDMRNAALVPYAVLAASYGARRHEAPRLDVNSLRGLEGPGLLAADNLAQLYRALALYPVAKLACARVVEAWTQRAGPLPPDLDVGDRVTVIDMARSDFFSTMLAMCAVRAAMNRRHAQLRRGVRTLSILAFGAFDVLIVNTKDAYGNGTSRVVWPIALPKDPHELREHQTRVLDLTYRDIAAVVLGPLLAAFRGDGAACAEAMLSVLHGSRRVAIELQGKPVVLGAFRCSFLRGVRVSQRGAPPTVASRFWLTRKSQQSMDLGAQGHRTNAYEVICNVLAILFVAEPRHARVMFRATEVQLELVSDGFLGLGELFGNVGGLIAHGRLLPGANVLGPAMQGNMAEKRTAMPMADLLGPYQAVLRHRAGALRPQYEPLMKVLFTVLLHEAFQFQGWTRRAAEPAPRDLEALGTREDAEREEDLDHEDRVPTDDVLALLGGGAGAHAKSGSGGSDAAGGSGGSPAVASIAAASTSMKPIAATSEDRKHAAPASAAAARPLTLSDVEQLRRGGQPALIIITHADYPRLRAYVDANPAIKDRLSDDAKRKLGL